MMRLPSDEGVIDRDRHHRMAMRFMSQELYKRLIQHHPKIVAHLQSLPNAQPVALDVDT